MIIDNAHSLTLSFALAFSVFSKSPLRIYHLRTNVAMRLAVIVVAEVVAITQLVSAGLRSPIDHKPNTLYFLSMLPYPDPEPSLNPSIADGPDLFPAVQLAVDHVNNRSDVLRDYHIELIETDGGCDISSKALISLASQLFHSDKQIAGIIGPSCSESAEAVGAMSRRSEIALLSFHQGSSSLLTNRTAYPYSIGMAPSHVVEALLLFVDHFNFSNIVVLYNKELLVDRSLYFELIMRADQLDSVNVTFSDFVSKDHIPFENILHLTSSSVIVAIVEDFHDQLLCVAFHKAVIFPQYQWIFTTDNEIRVENVSFYYPPDERAYFCSSEEMKRAVEGVAKIMTRSENQEAAQVGAGKILDGKYKQLAYDSVWAMALALNGSLETLQEKNMSLTNYTYGQSSATEVILEHLYQLEFRGESGLIRFDRETNFIKLPLLIVQFVNGSTEIVSRYENGSLNVTDSEDRVFGQLIIEEEEFPVILVGIGVALASVALLLIASTHIFSLLYYRHPIIKKSDPNISQLICVGCYLLITDIYIYTFVPYIIGITEAYCSVNMWLLFNSFTLIFATVAAKAWKMYRILYTSYKLRKGNGLWVRDYHLALMVFALVSVSIVFCAVLSATHAIELQTKVYYHESSQKHYKATFCVFKPYTWIVIAYDFVILAFVVFLSVVTHHYTKIREFKSNKNVLFLVYFSVFFLASGLSFYLVILQYDTHLTLRYLVAVAVIALVYLCWGLLFLPHALPLLRKKLVKKRTLLRN